MASRGHTSKPDRKRGGMPAGARSSTATLPLFTSAMKKVEPARELAQVDNRPNHLTTGLASLDRALQGGLPVGGITLVAARPQAGATSLLMGATLAALKKRHPVSYFSERLPEDQLRGRLVVLESKVNGTRFRAGFVTAEDRIALAAARERIPWSQLYLSTKRRISPSHIDTSIFTYRPWLVVADVQPRPPQPAPYQARQSKLQEGVERLASLARKHHVSMVVRMLLPRGQHPPQLEELPSLGSLAELFTALVLLHREETSGGGDSSRAYARVLRVRNHAVEPRDVELTFDQRYAGLLEP